MSGEACNLGKSGGQGILDDELFPGLTIEWAAYSLTHACLFPCLGAITRRVCFLD